MTKSNTHSERAERRGPKRPAALLALAAAVACVAALLSGSIATGCACGEDAEAVVSSVQPVTATTAPPVTTPSVPSTTTTDTAPATNASTTRTTALTTTTTVYTHVIPQPKRIVIPAIDVDAPMIHVGLRENGDMDLPSFGLAAWYELGPAPGANGPAVIVGHVDSKKGRDVFYRLKELEPGDEILVYGEDGDVATFVVDSQEQTLKTELPTERIWNDTEEPVIRLITCGGKFDRSTGHYLSNVIIYGHLLR